MCQNTGNRIRPWRRDYHRHSGKDANRFRPPIFPPVAIGVHDEDNKNPRVSICESPTDDILPIAGWSFRGTNRIDRETANARAMA